VPTRPTHDPQYLDEHHQRISEFAGEYFDDDEERESFVTELMARRGYTPSTRTEWAPAAAPPNPPAPPQPKRAPYFKPSR